VVTTAGMNLSAADVICVNITVRRNVNGVNMQISDRPHYHHGNLARVLVETCLEMVEADGVQSVSLRDVAKRCAVSPAAVYRHFSDKADLLAAIAALGFARLNAAFQQALDDQKDASALAQFRALGRAYIAHGLEHGPLYRLMFGTSGLTQPAPPASCRSTGDGPNAHPSQSWQSLEAESSRAFATLNQVVEQCFPQPVSQSALSAATIAAWSLVHGYVMLRLEGQFSGFSAQDMPDIDSVLANLVPWPFV
jgi:AcrR family transcriptional regulator